MFPTDELRRVLSVFKNARIYADIVHVDTSTVVPEIFDYFKPKNYCFNPCRKKLSVATAVFPSGPFVSSQRSLTILSRS